MKTPNYKTALYRRWTGMRNRCRNQNFEHFNCYGGRGITVCERWDSFENFKADMGATFKPKLQIERRDNLLGYSPDNCYWTTRAQQARNRRSNRRLTIKGISLCVTDWAKRLGIRPGTIFQRVYRGWPIEKVLS